ncbi:hypothetical protein ACH5RR_034823 [Cinchona calisaya]|uniref:Amino acid transporter transmembrane domain-containing protein n=1 Tax=Cinchona calisaya TaxID=153742 RepID=A0ABD2YF38_9GENT
MWRPSTLVQIFRVLQEKEEADDNTNGNENRPSLNGFGVGAFTLDWSTVATFLFSPLISPFVAIANVFVGYVLIMCVVIPVSYWGLNVYNAKTFRIFSSDLFTAQGREYNISTIVDRKFKLDIGQYEQQGRIHLSTFLLSLFGFGFPTIAST